MIETGVCAARAYFLLPSATGRHCYRGAPYRRPLGAAWPGEPRSDAAFRRAHAIAPRRPRDTGGTPSMPDDWGNALVRWVVLVELEEVIAQHLKG
jgi:hypothetical protein